jgi:cholesterol transport system auxiliary component
MNPIARAALLLALAVLPVACVSRPDVPLRTYDFGLAAAPEPGQLSVHVREIEAPDWLERTEMLYRLAYREPRGLEPYSRSHWAGTPASMLTLRLRQALGHVEARSARCVLAIDLEEFSQVFDSERSSRALLHARASLRQAGGQRPPDLTVLRLQRPAPTPDAAGAAAAFSVLADELTSQLRNWIAGLGYCQ